MTDGKEATAQNYGKFRVVRLDGKWWDAQIVNMPDLRERIGPVPDEWVLPGEEVPPSA